MTLGYTYDGVLFLYDDFDFTNYNFFHRTKSGIWGWRSDKSEIVNGFEAKVHTSYPFLYNYNFKVFVHCHKYEGDFLSV